MRSLLLMIVFLGWAVLVLSLSSAPAPKKVQKPDSIVLTGAWMLTWGEERCPTTFTKEGVFWCLFKGEPWSGTWRLDNKTLRVSEARVPRPGEQQPPCITWEVDLARPARAKPAHVQNRAWCGEVKGWGVRFGLVRD